IRDLGLELQVIFNKDSVMVLPGGVNKATGLAAALAEMEMSPHNVIGIGDAENDHAFLSLCEGSVAVPNALPMLKEEPDMVMQHAEGKGVAELVEQVLGDDLRSRSARFRRHRILLGTRPDGTEVHIPVLGINVLIVGTSGSGKSTLTTALVERVAEQGYQFC